jgi:DNA-3-methyladenine glycosylase
MPSSGMQCGSAARWRHADFTDHSPVIAKKLIGALLLVNGVGGIIVETEAYDESEPASHSFSGQTPRNSVLFGPPGRAYVYFSYGLHWALNIVCREAGHGAGVLIRALEPTVGIRTMRRRRRQTNLRILCAGPGRLAQALGITGALNGRRIDLPPFEILCAARRPKIVRGPRIGISKATERAWRFGLSGSVFQSRPFPTA